MDGRSTPSDILREADKMTDLRRGQALFTALQRLDPNKAEQLRLNREADPFYTDNNIPRFWARVAELNEEAA